MDSNPFNLANYLKEAGGVFKFGSGVLGKSAIVVGIVLVAAVVAIWKLHSDFAILGVLAFAAIIFFLWFFKVLKFAEAHPDIAVLEGAEWSSYQRFQASAKGYLPPSSEQVPVILPGTNPALPTANLQNESDKEL